MIDFPHSEDNIVEYFARAMRAEVAATDTSYTFKIRLGESHREFALERARLQSLISAIRQKDLGDETALFTDNSFEIIVSEESPFPGRRMRDEAIRVCDNESTITYEVSPVSDEYLLWLIALASSQGIPRDLGFGMFPPRLRLERLAFDDKDGELDAFDALRAVSARLISLKLSSTAKLNLRRYQVATHSFLFHLAYNLDVALVPQRYFEEVSRRGRISRMRRNTAEDLDPPRRTYNEDLVNHYILAISTDSPTVQFLSHYHVLEHFFESVFNDDLLRIT